MNVMFGMYFLYRYIKFEWYLTIVGLVLHVNKFTASIKTLCSNLFVYTVMCAKIILSFPHCILICTLSASTTGQKMPTSRPVTSISILDCNCRQLPHKSEFIATSTRQ